MGLGKSLNEEVVVVEDGEEVVGGGEFNKSFGGSTVSCSICLEVVADNGDRSWAKLQCGHQFHLDCIGSAFNIKGAMQCPNCRKIEKGKWLYANGCRSVPEFNMDDWAHEEDLDDLSYSEMSLGVGVGVHWCPLSSVARIHPSFEEGEFSSNAYHELFGQRAFLTEHTAAVASACPYVYMGPVHHPSNSSSSGSVSDGSSFNRHWSGPSIPSELPSSYAFPAMDVHYHSWEHHSPLFSTTSSRMAPADHPSIPSTRRSARNSSDLPRSGSFVHPFLLGHSFSDRASSSVASSISQPYQGSNARSRDRVQALQAYYQQQQPGSSPTSRAPMTPGARRSSSHRGMSQAGTMASSSDQSGFYFIPAGASGRSFQEAESTTHSRFRTRERDHPPSYPLNRTDRDAAWVAFHQNAGGSDPGTRSSSLRQWDGSERMPSSQNRS